MCAENVLTNTYKQYISIELNEFTHIKYVRKRCVYKES